MYCFAEYPVRGGSGIPCFADRAACRATQTQ